jgi:hypothetical protein
MTYTLKELIDSAFTNYKETPDGWVPARPRGAGLLYRIKAAWLVITGKADAVTWPDNQ